MLTSDARFATPHAAKVPTLLAPCGMGLRLMLMLVMLAAAPPPSTGQDRWVKLSDGQSFSDVQLSFAIGPRGNRVMYVHDADFDNAFELWSVPMTGGTPVRLSGLLPSGSEVFLHRFTPNGLTAVYSAPQDTLDLYELYSVPVTGGAPVKLNLPTTFPGVGNFQVSPDGARVVFAARTPSAVRLYSVPSGGGSTVILGGDLFGGGALLISPDGSRVAYQADQNNDGRDELYSVPILGGALPIMVGLTGDPQVIQPFAFSPDGSRLVYRLFQPGVADLFSVPATGGTSVKLNQGPTADDKVRAFRISPNTSRVVFLAERETNGTRELFSVPIVGGAPVKLSGALAPGGNVVSFQIGSNGFEVVYLADQQDNEVFELFWVHIDGGTVVKLNGTLVAGGDVLDFKLNADNSWVVYRADQIVDGVPFGFRVPLGGPAGSDELIWQTAFVADEDSYQIVPGGHDVILRGNLPLADSIKRLWRVPLTGTPDPIAEELVRRSAFDPQGDVSFFRIGPKGSIVYVADQDTNGVSELYAIPTLIFSDGFES